MFAVNVHRRNFPVRHGFVLLKMGDDDTPKRILPTHEIKRSYEKIKIIRFM